MVLSILLTLALLAGLAFLLRRHRRRRQRVFDPLNEWWGKR